MLGQVSQVNGNIQNNTSIKSQDTVPQATRHQTPPNILKSFESTPTFEQLTKSGRREHLSEKKCSMILFLGTNAYMLHVV